MSGVVFSDRRCLGYRLPGHPESPERVSRTLERLEAGGFEIRPPRPASDADLLRVHSPPHLNAVRAGLFHDPDTPFFPGIDGIARLSAGGALAAARSALEGLPAFSLMRPPGHHAGESLGVSGFCYYNNLAAAVAWAREQVERVAILDIDVHHGNGTEELLRGKEGILFCSLHQIPLYPGSGGRSFGNCLNFPLSPATGEPEYLKTLDQALERISDFRPQLLAVSAGFDTYRDDPLAGLRLDIPSYEKIGRKAAGLGCPRFAVLEGGYSEDLPGCVESFLRGFFGS